MEAEVQNIGESDSTSTTVDGEINHLKINECSSPVKEAILKTDSSDSADTVIFIESDEPEIEDGHASLVTAQGEVDVDDGAQGETENDSAQKSKIMDDSEIEKAFSLISAIEAPANETDIGMINSGVKDTADSLCDSITDSILEKGVVPPSPSSDVNRDPRVKYSEENENQIQTRSEVEAEDNEVPPEFMDSGVVVEDDEIQTDSSPIDELIIAADEPIDEQVMVKYEMEKSIENGYDDSHAREHISTPNFSVDLLENGQLLAKTEMEFENEDEVCSPRLDDKEWEENVKMETDDSNVDLETNSILEIGLPVVNRIISHTNDCGIDAASDVFPGNLPNEEQTATNSLLPENNGKEQIKMKRGRSRSISYSGANHPLFLLPFEFGWKRELVLRSESHFKRGDVYYFAPNGRKLRSMKKIEDYLKANNIQDLTLANFTYSMATFNSPSDILRPAKMKRGSCGTSAQPSNTDTHTVSVPSSETDPLASTSHPPMKKTKTKSQAAPPNKKPNTINPITGKPVKKKKKKNVVTTANMQPPSMIPPTPEPYFVLKPAPIDPMDITYPQGLPPSQPSSSKQTYENVTITNNACEDNCETEIQLVRRCTHRCPGQEGVIPSLHCNKCLCLFHPRCVGISDSFAGSSNFTCQECGGGEVMLRKQMQTTFVKLKTPSGSAQWTVNNFPNTPPPPIYCDNSTKVHYRNEWGCGGSLESQLPPFNVSSSFPHETSAIMPDNCSDNCNFGTVKRFPCGVTIEKVQPGVSPGGPSELTSASISVFPMAPTSTCIRPLNPNKNALNMRVPNQCRPALEESPKSILRPVIIPVSNSAYPHHKNAVMKYTTPVRPPEARRNQYNRDRYLQNTNNGWPVQPKLSPMGLSLLKKPCHSQPGSPFHSTPPAEHSNNNNNRDNRCSTPILSKVKSTPEKRPVNQTSSMTSLNCGILTLVTIFKYLGAGDLLRVSQVCRAWRLLARHPAVWETIKLKDVMIKDWDVFVKIVMTLGTRHLDTTGMLVSGTRSSSFQGLVNAMNKLTDLEGLSLGETPPEVVYATMNRLPQLKHFSAEWIVDFNKDYTGPCGFVDIGNFTSMPNLERLQLRGLHGLLLPKLNSGLERLGSLKQLTCLAITSMKDVPSCEFGFLYELTNLRTLELGNCVNWNEGVYAAIGHMTNLRKLRLEFGGECAERGLQAILPALINLVQLELIIFRIPPNFGDLLSPLKKLKQLTVWPDLKHKPALNNYYTVMATTHITFVKIMMWGLVISHLTNQDGDAPNQVNHNSCCVPFLNSDPSCSSATHPATMIYISAHELMNKLRAKMPHSKVQVIMVPNESFSTICYMPR